MQEGHVIHGAETYAAVIQALTPPAEGEDFLAVDFSAHEALTLLIASPGDPLPALTVPLGLVAGRSDRAAYAIQQAFPEEVASRAKQLKNRCMDYPLHIVDLVFGDTSEFTAYLSRRP